jgi:hypothetical protein
VDNWRFEVTTFVASQAPHLKVLAEQWIVRLGMVKSRSERGLFPCGSRVAGFTTLLELSFMRVAMTRRASGKRNSCISWFAIAA